MAVNTSVAVVDLSSRKRSYTAGVYARALLLGATFAVLVALYVGFTYGDMVGTVLALGVAAVLAVLAWAMWTQQPWRYQLGLAVHGVGLTLGIFQLVRWLLHIVDLINANEDIAAAGGTLGAIWQELPSLEIDALTLGDIVLLLGLNVGALLALRFFRRDDEERRRDATHNSDADLFLQRFLGNASARVGGTIVLLLLLIAYVMPRVDPYHGAIVLRDGDLSRRLDAPDCLIGWLRLNQGIDQWAGEGDAPGSLFEFPCEHPFGFDKNGRDMARRVLHGISVSLAVSLIAVSISLFTGATIGLVAGYLGGWLDALLMRFMDIMLAFPALLLAIAIVAMRGPGLENGMIAIGIVGVPVYARLARSMAITVRRQEYVTAAQSIGASNWRILSQHVLPNSLAPLIVQSTLGLGTAVIETAALGFLGLGQQPPYPELGKMLADSREVMTSGKWWVMLFPGITVMMIVLGFNLLGDALRDTLDPQLRGKS